MHNLVNNDKIINFSTVFIINYKIVCLIKSPIIICGIFSEDTITPLIKLYLLHIYISFINFAGPSLPAVLYNISNNETTEHNKRYDINNSKYLKLKLYEVLFLNFNLDFYCKRINTKFCKGDVQYR